MQNVLKNFKGILGCDGWGTYKVFSENQGILLQRCWAHLLRKSKELCNSVVGTNFHEKLIKLFEEIKKFNESLPTSEQRIKKYEEMTKELKEIIDYYSKYDELKSVVKYINFNLENWFTCIKIEVFV